ncbi:MAG: carboxylesterase family protein [Bryobacterales bacterium]|nr:carboxylesterase family protein [Bryobacterales bacterium]
MFKRTSTKGWARYAAALLTVFMGVVAAEAQVPAGIEAQLVKIGHIVDPPCTAKLYRPLMPANDIRSDETPLYPGITVIRDASFGPNPKDVVDIFTADQGPGSRPVLIYVPGGAGNKLELQSTEANAFYDNIGRWATKNGMVGVNMQRHAGQAWDDGAKDISAMIQWVEANISKYHGNPDRMFIWAHSAGNMPLGTYIGRPELYGPKGVGVKGVIFMSPAPFDIAPLELPPPPPGSNPFAILADAGKTCGAKGGAISSEGALPGRAAGQPGGPDPAFNLPGGSPTSGSSGGRPGGPPAGFGGPPVDDATRLARSSLPELKKTSVKILLANAELDPGADPAVNGGIVPFNQMLHDELCKEGPAHCPTLLYAKGESHMSEVFSIDTRDKTVSGPILVWIKKIK